jgi:hypothetical protein
MQQRETMLLMSIRLGFDTEKPFLVLVRAGGAEGH